VDVIGHQMALLDPAFLLLGQIVKDNAEMPSQFSVQRLPSVFRDEDDVIFAVPFRVI
jgi:hypothetical protein